MSAEVIRITDYRFVGRRSRKGAGALACPVVPLFRSLEPARTLVAANLADDEDRFAGRGRDAG